MHATTTTTTKEENVPPRRMSLFVHRQLKERNKKKKTKLGILENLISLVGRRLGAFVVARERDYIHLLFSPLSFSNILYVAYFVCVCVCACRSAAAAAVAIRHLILLFSFFHGILLLLLTV
jgi:hypothetical protein